MVKVAIVEDDGMYALQLSEYLCQFSRENGIEIIFDVFTDGAILVERYNRDYDIIIMDIEMPLLDGMGAAEEIRKFDDEVIILFVTNVAQYAIKGYAVGALDYVLKPISYFAFSQSLNKAIARARKAAVHYITVRMNRGIQKLNVVDIKYIESRDHQLIYHTLSGDVITSGTIKNAEADLRGAHFAKGNRGCLINLRHVDSVRGGSRDGYAIVDGEHVPLSRSNKEKFEAALVSYISEVTK